MVSKSLLTDFKLQYISVLSVYVIVYRSGETLDNLERCSPSRWSFHSDSISGFERKWICFARGAKTRSVCGGPTQLPAQWDSKKLA